MTAFIYPSSSSIPYIDKDPNDVLDYTVDWETWLGADTITGTPSWAIDPSGELSIASQANTTTTATVFLSGGTAGDTYSVRCRIVTTGGRTKDQSFLINCVER